MPAAPTLPRLQPFDTASYYRTKGKVLVHVHQRSRCIVASVRARNGDSVALRGYVRSFQRPGPAEKRGEEKGCTHIRRRRITHRKSHVRAATAREKREARSWTPFGRDSIRGEGQTEPPFFRYPSASADHAFSTYRHNRHNIAPASPCFPRSLATPTLLLSVTATAVSIPAGNVVSAWSR